MLKLFLAELKRVWTQFWRYPTEAIGSIVVTTILFYGLFLGGRYIAGPSFQSGERLDTIIIGYVLWSLMQSIMVEIALGLQQEAQTGTLEQLFLSAFGASRVFIVRSLAGLTVQLTRNLSILFIIMLITGSWLSFPPLLLLPLFTVVLGAYGLALAAGSLALLVKQVQQFLFIFNFGFLFVLATPTETLTGPIKLLSWLLPMAPGAGLLRELMVRERSLDLATFSVALLNGVAYFAIGLILFQWAEQEVKRRGKLSGY